jgi:hypothetical protein
MNTRHPRFGAVITAVALIAGLAAVGDVRAGDLPIDLSGNWAGTYKHPQYRGTLIGSIEQIGANATVSGEGYNPYIPLLWYFEGSFTILDRYLSGTVEIDDGNLRTRPWTGKTNRAGTRIKLRIIEADGRIIKAKLLRYYERPY